ncbi:MAG: TM0106 family RecB-like putative nuclease [Leptolyngbyaceae bacterium]|nr:TM0106 family RecB-like putative nuclease [Leptolyngbyaceae bacterium]
MFGRSPSPSNDPTPADAQDCEQNASFPVSSPDLEATSVSNSATPFSLEDGVVIFEDVLLNFQRCNRRAFLDMYGDRTHRDPPSDYLQKLQLDSLTHQKSVLSDWPAVTPAYSSHQWEAGYEATLDLMWQGVERISRGVLLNTHSDGTVLISRPKLLVRQPGQSIFGNYLYVAVDIKLGKRAKSDYQIISAYHTYVLANVQDAWPETSLLILRHQNVYEVNLFDQVPKMMTILDDCIQTLQHRQEPDVFIARNRCDLCHWFNHCYSQARDTRHLSLLPGVTPNRYAQLETLELTTVERLSATSPAVLQDLPGFGTHIAQKLVRQAQSTHYQIPLLSPHGEELLLQGASAIHELLPMAPVEIYFDIEAAPERELIYLHGVLTIDRQNNTQTFYGLLADHPDDEQRIWEQFLELAEAHPMAPIYHFCPYEHQTVRKLASSFDTPAERVEALVERFVDVHDCIIRTTTLPIESYALKAIARWAGFEWRDEGANGAQSIYWYDQWLETGDRTYLDTILRYNEDDCRATWVVKDWLTRFMHEQLSQQS